MWEYLIAIPLIAHGLANLAGAFAPWTKTMQGFTNATWAFSGGVTLKSGVGRIFSLLWLASSVCLVLAGAGLLLSQSWWLPLGIAGCSLSLLAILPWFKAVPPGAKFAVVFDILVIVLLVLTWENLFMHPVQ